MASDIKLSILDTVRVASPCSARWEDMTGDERTRHCGMCKLSVHNISDMSREEAEDFLLNSVGTGRVCARFYRRDDGTILTKDCPVGLAAARATLSRMVRAIAAGLGLLISGGVMAGLASKPNHASRLAGMEPFASLLARLNPIAPVPARGLIMGKVIMGEIACPTLPPPQAPAPPLQPAPAATDKE